MGEHQAYSDACAERGYTILGGEELGLLEERRHGPRHGRRADRHRRSVRRAGRAPRRLLRHRDRRRAGSRPAHRRAAAHRRRRRRAAPRRRARRMTDVPRAALRRRGRLGRGRRGDQGRVLPAARRLRRPGRRLRRDVPGQRGAALGGHGRHAAALGRGRDRHRRARSPRPPSSWAASTWSPRPTARPCCGTRCCCPSTRSRSARSCRCDLSIRRRRARHRGSGTHRAPSDHQELTWPSSPWCSTATTHATPHSPHDERERAWAAHSRVPAALRRPGLGDRRDASPRRGRPGAVAAVRRPRRGRRHRRPVRRDRRAGGRLLPGRAHLARRADRGASARSCSTASPSRSGRPCGSSTASPWTATTR